MQNPTRNIPVLFANTGVQIVCVRLQSNLRFTGDQLGHGWQRCSCQVGTEETKYPYIQWQIANQGQLLLAVDTTLGPAETSDTNGGYFCTEGRILGDFDVSLKGLLGVNGKPLEGLGEVDVKIRPAAAEGGEPKDVDLVIDFGNNRTGGLLIEFQGDVAQDPLMHPLQLMHRWHLDSWDEKGEIDHSHGKWWFSSRSQWCAPPYQDPPSVDNVVWVEESAKSLFGRTKTTKNQTTVSSLPETFQDFSQVRLGQEAHDLSLVMRTDGEVRTSLSSPKRYLWAKDSSWLEGANWHMADPFGRYDNERHAAPLQGPMLRYISKDDKADRPGPDYEVNPSRPNHAPRVLMMGALYEILAQSYSYMNSPTYRRTAGEPQRMRRLRSVTLTYPSGMIVPERLELERQARKAVHLFKSTVARKQDKEPEFKLSIDEASAVHLTYIWSEIQKLSRKPDMWFELMGRAEPPEVTSKDSAELSGADSAEDSPLEETKSRRRPRTGGGRRGGQNREKDKSSSILTLPKVRVACIDIGGGTSDLMIAEYKCESRTGGSRVIGKTLHRDGIYRAGDDLVKRLLERVVVPQFADAVGLENHDVQRLFGSEVRDSLQFRAQRVNWMNRLFVPLAQKYLEYAVDEGYEDEEICHTDPDIVAPDVIESLQATINELWDEGHCQVNQPLGLYFDRAEIEDIVDEVFGDLIFDFCETIVQHNADVVLLAGLPTKLSSIQELVKTSLPLPNSRIIPMHNRYVGTWYPYQNPDHMNPGVIVDPKSTVVVGAAVEFSARYGMLSQFKFHMEDDAAKRSYYWGVMTESRIDDHQILFENTDDLDKPPTREEHVLNVTDRRLVIGRKSLRRENAQASPVYVVKVDAGQRLGEIEVDVTLTRTRGEEGEEQIEVQSVVGDVAGEPAVEGKNIFLEWRTLADERYYLDTGGLDKIELGD